MLSIQYTNTLSSKLNKENNKDRIYLILNKILQNYYMMVADCKLHTATGQRYFRHQEASSRLVQGTIKPKAGIKQMRSFRHAFLLDPNSWDKSKWIKAQTW